MGNAWMVAGSTLAALDLAMTETNPRIGGAAMNAMRRENLSIATATSISRPKKQSGALEGWYVRGLRCTTSNVWIWKGDQVRISEIN